ncbi:MAG: hypothetical protein ACREP2_02400, partial [Rhodanobacteraceae bacterium]
NQLLNPVPGRAFAKKQELAEFVSQELFYHGFARMHTDKSCRSARSVSIRGKGFLICNKNLRNLFLKRKSQRR